jgi:hypothetical protein
MHKHGHHHRRDKSPPRHHHHRDESPPPKLPKNINFIGSHSTHWFHSPSDHHIRVTNSTSFINITVHIGLDENSRTIMSQSSGWGAHGNVSGNVGGGALGGGYHEHKSFKAERARKSSDCIETVSMGDNVEIALPEGARGLHMWVYDTRSGFKIHHKLAVVNKMDIEFKDVAGMGRLIRETGAPFRLY